MFRAGLSPSRSSQGPPSSPFSHLRRSPSTASLSTATSPPSTPSSKSRFQTSSSASTNTPTPTTTRKKTASARAAAARLAGGSPGKAKAAEASLSNASATASATTPTPSLPASDSIDSIDVSFEEARTHQPVHGEEEDATAAPAKQNVVVCVRVRPAASAVADGEQAEELWSLNTTENRLAPTEQHPSLAKRAPSSSAQPSTSTSSTLLSASGSAGDVEALAAYDFRFDKLVGPQDGTDAMYTHHISPLVRAAVQGYNGTVFAYGQTGSGKTHTMSGTESEPGVITRAVEEVWSAVEAEPNREFLLRVSYLEIYNETLRDLLAPLPSSLSSSASSSDLSGRPSSPTKGGSTPTSISGALRIIETPSRVQVVGLREDIVTSPSGVLALLAAGQAQRQTAATDWNERSSRSHCVFTITIESKAKDALGKEVRVSQLNLIDLAGSERAASSSERRKEGAFINKSLLTLGTVIAKLSESSSSDEASTQHIPYRDSKLTRLLQNSLGGNARVAVVCTMSPAKAHAVESLSTLKFGRRCKQITTRARRGTVLDDKALLQRYKRELDRLRARLESGANTASVAEESAEGLAADAEGEQRVRELENRRETAERDVKAVELQREDLKKQVEHLTRLILTSQSVAEERTREGTTMPSSLSLANLAATSTRARPRFSDFGPASPTKRQSGFDAPSSPAPPSITTPTLPSLGSSRPFAMEAELASLRRELASALAARQAAESARSNESAQWAARTEELESTNRALEEDLDAADEWCKKAKAELAEAEKKALEAKEANRLLSLVAKSKAARDGSDEASKAREEAHRLELEAAKREASAAAEAEKQRIHAEAEAAKRSLESEMSALKEQLEAERKAADAARKELSELNRESLQENAERDFAQLVRGATSEGTEMVNVAPSDDEETQKRTAELDERAAELERRALEVERREEEVEKLRASFRPLPVPQPPLDPNAGVQARVELERRVKELEMQATMLQRDLESAQRSAAAVANSQVASSPPRQSAAERADIVELQVEVDVQRSQIASLERQLAEARASRTTPGSPSKLRDWSGTTAPDVAAPTTPTPSSPMTARRYDRFGALTAGAAAGASLHRGGSVREYRKYSSTPDSPFNIRTHEGFAPRTRLSAIAGDLNESARVVDQAAIEAAVRAEREGIERLNAVIASQRALMADLEKSVALWKVRLQLQQNIIERLLQSGESAGTASGGGGAGRLQEISFNTGRKRLSGSSSVMSAVARASPAPSTLGGHEPLRRAGSTASYVSRTTGSASPYYGAHTFNRPAGLGLAPPSPSKGIGAWSGLPGGPGGPEPLPMPERLDAEEQLRRSRKPRRTIDNDIKALSSSPRVEATKHRLLEPQHTQTSPTKFAKPLPVPGRATRDFYI